MTYDLGVTGGKIVTPAGRARLHVYCAEERIAEISSEHREARETVDATGLLVMPGMVDAHVHLMDPGDPTREDFPSGTAAAARAGVTTIVEHTHGAPVISADDLTAKREHLRARSRVDFALAAHAWPDRLEEVPGVWAAGAVFVKAFTCATHGLPAFDAATLRDLFASIARCDATCLVHCEDDALTRAAERDLRAVRTRGRRGDPRVAQPRGRAHRADGRAAPRQPHPGARRRRARQPSGRPGSRPRPARRELPAVPAAARARGPRAGRAAQVHPAGAGARPVHDLDEMWRALADRRIDYLSSDHSPSTLEQKREGSIWDVHFGLPGIDTTLSVLLDGAHAGRISYERVAEVYSEAPARLYGLWPRKGRLAPGADADLVVVDPEERWTVRDEDILSRRRGRRSPARLWRPRAPHGAARAGGRGRRGRARRTGRRSVSRGPRPGAAPWIGEREDRSPRPR